MERLFYQFIFSYRPIAQVIIALPAMTFIAIILGTLTAGIGSVWLAAALSFGVLAKYTQHMLSLAAGALLATAFMHLLPEAFESQASAHDLFAALLVGLVFFFLLDKAELWHHGHEHAHGHGHGHGHAGDHSHHNNLSQTERSAGPPQAVQPQTSVKGGSCRRRLAQRQAWGLNPVAAGPCWQATACTALVMVF